jgi:hypothetical protein
MAWHTKVIHLVENKGIYSSYRVLPTDSNVAERHGDPGQKHGWRSPCGTVDKGSKLARFRAVEVLLAQLTTRVCVLTVSHQDETHLFFIDVATAGITRRSLAEPWELPEFADIGERRMCFQGLFRDVIEGKMILENKGVHGLSQSFEWCSYLAFDTLHRCFAAVCEAQVTLKVGWDIWDNGPNTVSGNVLPTCEHLWRITYFGVDARRLAATTWEMSSMHNRREDKRSPILPDFAVLSATTRRWTIFYILWGIGTFFLVSSATGPSELHFPTTVSSPVWRNE